MSSTTYQTTAKPRGRKESEQIPAELDTSSRTSSQASQRLAKTVSRTMEESQTVKSRSHSPAFFWHRNKAIDATQRDSTPTPTQTIVVQDVPAPARPQSMSFTSSQLGAEGVSIPGAFPTTGSVEQSRISMPLSSTLSRVMSQTQSKARRSPSRSRTHSLTQSSIARMQPTVVDASEDETSRTTTTARSSATSLDLKSAQGSDVGIKQVEKAPTPPPPPPSYSPPKPPVADANKSSTAAVTTMASATNTPRRSNSRSGNQYATQHQQMYYPPPSSFPSSSPRQYTADTTANGQQVASSPAISPPHSPLLMHQPLYGSPMAGPYPYGYPPQTAPGQLTTTSFYGEMQHLPSPPLTSTFDDQTRNIDTVGIDDSQRDWAKLSSVLPELNRLLSRYEDQKGQSSARDSFAKQMDHHRTHEMASLRVELEANKSEYEKVIQKLVTESFELKRDIESRDKTIVGMQASIADLSKQKEDSVAAHTEYQRLLSQHSELRSKHDLQDKHSRQAISDVEALKADQVQLQKKLDEALSEAKFFRSENATWKTRYQEAAGASDQARLAKEDLVANRMKLEAAMEDLRRKGQAREEKHASEIKALRREYEAMIETKEKERTNIMSDHKASLGSVQLELAGLADRYSRQRKDVDNARAQVTSLEKKLDSKARDREEQTTRHRQQMDAKNKELEEQAASHRRQLEAQLSSLTSQRQRDLDAQKQEHDKALHDLRKSHEAKILRLGDDHATELKKVHGDFNAHKATHEAHKRETEDLRVRHGELASVMVSWRQRQEEWQAEQNKLNKILEAFDGGRKGK